MIEILKDDAVTAMPAIGLMQTWAKAALPESAPAAAAKTSENPVLAIRIVDATTMESLNSEFADKKRATNVLSFPAQIEPELAAMLEEPVSLGDIAICADVVENEAREQSKSSDAHWAHMVVHGVLHLRGFDHIGDEDAALMEAEEVRLLAGLGFSNPYSAGQCALVSGSGEARQ